jgi:4-amino-4-deoxy-L-arabinose transferase-like glycosyltransferase
VNVAPVPGWAWRALVVILLFDVWWRCHTFGPTIARGLGFAPWPVVSGDAEPLDCDEAAYGYIGRRLNQGAVMYRDLTENKPPGGYWLYALAVAIGGPNELTVRLLPLPLVLGTIALVWWIALRLAGPGASCVAAMAYAVLSTDPYLYGNGAQLEQAMNLFATGALALMMLVLRAVSGARRRGLAVAAGAALGAACLVKQVAILHAVVFAAALLLRREEGRRPAMASRLLDLAALGAGFVLVWAAAAGYLAWQGALAEAFEDVVRYGGALATLTPAEPNAPPGFIRWITGNADPQGHLPPPFGKTDYLVWWGNGSWPCWLAGLAAIARLAIAPTTPQRRLVAGWTVAAGIQVVLPGLYWPHYYLLPLPGMAVAIGVVLAGSTRRAVESGASIPARAASATAALALLAALGGTAYIQVRDYLLVAPEQLTIRYKGGRQWVELRRMGRGLARRARVWNDPHIFVWGWQSPLYFYSGLDSVTPHFFADPLLRAYAGKNHPLIRPRIERIARDIDQHRPEIIMAGEVPFPELAALLRERYIPSRLSIHLPDGRGLWVEPTRYAEFERPRMRELGAMAP